MDFTKLDKLKARLDQHRPMDDGTLQNIREDLLSGGLSNTIGGNTLKYFYVLGE